MNCTPECNTNGKIQHLGWLLAAGLVAGGCGSGRAVSESAAQAVAPAMWADGSTPSKQHFQV